MHLEARRFTEYIKSILPFYFNHKKVIDIGGGDINGTNNHLFNDCEVYVNDVIDAPNVNIVCKTKDLPFEDETFDTIISTECFEHDPEYTLSFLKIYNILKPDGLFLFTCAGFGRPEHGTIRTTPFDSYGTIGKIEEMVDYYKNLTEKDLNDVLKLKDLFSSWDTYYNQHSKDLYFVGIKKGKKIKVDLPKYVENDVILTSSYI